MATEISPRTGVLVQRTGDLLQTENSQSLAEQDDDESAFVLGSIVFFFLVFTPFFAFLLLKVFKIIVEVDNAQSGDFRYAAMQWLGAFSVAAGFGAMGVWTSFLSRRKDLLEPAKIKFGYTIILAYLLGSVLGCIFLLLFVGNFLSGDLFPAITSTTDPKLFYPIVHKDHRLG